MRTVIDIPEQEMRYLTQLSLEDHISRAEAIRRAVSQYLAVRKTTNSDQSAFGLWNNRKTDGLEYEDQARKEWSLREGRG
jgi:metal-responsive CopG/Arc/MetJ family transcriptional regulator